jgi:hypothetical protein
MAFLRPNHARRQAIRATRSVEFNKSGEGLTLLKNISNAEVVKSHVPTSDFKDNGAEKYGS